MLKGLLKFLRFYLIPLYVVVLIGLYFFQEKIIFQATSLSDNFKFHFDQDFVEEFVEVEDGTQINTLYFPSQGKSKGLLFYCHGNRRNLKTWGRFADEFTRHGYDVFMWDYRGFGKTKGSPSERVIFKDASFLYSRMLTKYAADSVVVYGRSLGSGVATYLAAQVTPKKLILETPYLHMADVGYKHFPLIPYNWLIKHPFRTDQYITNVDCPIHIFHGTDDELVPYESSLDIARLLNQNPDDLITTIEEGTHRGLQRFPMYQQSLSELLD